MCRIRRTKQAESEALMIGQNPFVEEGRTRFRNFQRRLGGYLAICLIIGLLAGGGLFWRWTRAGMEPLQKIYLKQYVWGSVRAAVSRRSASKYRLLTCQVKDAAGRLAIGGVVDQQVHPVRDKEGRPIRSENGLIFAWNKPNRRELAWIERKMNDRQMVALLREHHYGGESFLRLLLPALITGLIITLGGTVGLVACDQRLNKKYEEGKFVRGTRLVRPEKFRSGKNGPPGLGVPSLGTRRGWFKKDKPEPLYWLRISREDEATHTSLLGDTGTGKSQLIHLFLWQIAERRPQEAVIVYDPAGEFVASHFSAGRGDIILNPLDERFPFWNLSGEVRLKTDREMIAESFFPGNEGYAGAFFLKATRSIFARLLEFAPSPEELTQWLIDEREIDRRVRGTELVHLIGEKAPQQRGGVLGTLSEAGNRLKILPPRRECASEILLTEWAQKRTGWIFVTSTQDTRAQLRPLHAIFLDLLMKRLMACDPGWGREHTCWMIVDEAHALGKMPALYSALTEGRKFGLKLVVGTQNKTQFEEHYGRAAATMLAASVLKVIFRCNEPESARWVSELIGEEEWEKPRTGVTASVADRGRDSLHYSNNIEKKFTVSREEIMALEKLHGYWKYRDRVVRFRFPAHNWPAHTDRFIHRQSMLADQKGQTSGQAAAQELGDLPPKYKFVHRHLSPTEPNENEMKGAMVRGRRSLRVQKQITDGRVLDPEIEQAARHTVEIEEEPEDVGIDNGMTI
jgi:Type IV secretion-system coupling protein DNA-binding domain